jgi:endonuclease/exonuclease/phosphatase (EEP) superfamily protein YafD
MARDRDEVLARLAAEARESQGPVVMVGDLNATPWCHGMKPVFAAGLRDTRWGRGLATTWRSNNPLVAIPIDHVLIKGALAVANHRIGPELGSDHRAVVVDLLL